MQVNSNPMPRYGASGAPAKRRALASLRGLPRSPLASYARRALDAAREAAQPIATLRSLSRRLLIREFLGNNLFAWIASYLRNRFGPRHPFADYRRTLTDKGIYPLESAPRSAWRCGLPRELEGRGGCADADQRALEGGGIRQLRSSNITSTTVPLTAALAPAGRRISALAAAKTDTREVS